MTVTVERFKDASYARARYRLRHDTRKDYLHDGFTQGSYKFKSDAEMQADSMNLGRDAALAKRDDRYEFKTKPRTHHDDRYSVWFKGSHVGDASSKTEAYKIAGEHLARRLSVGAA